MFRLCRNTPPEQVFAQYHYNFVAYLPENTILARMESLTFFLLGMTILCLLFSSFFLEFKI
jgi:hypothetical protein